MKNREERSKRKERNNILRRQRLEKFKSNIELKELLHHKCSSNIHSAHYYMNSVETKGNNFKGNVVLDFTITVRTSEVKSVRSQINLLEISLLTTAGSSKEKSASFPR